jgi:hypothetical protein
MSVAHLPVTNRNAASTVQSLSERIRLLQAETQSIARDHIASFQRVLAEAVALAEEIAEGGEAYPVGAREIARRLAPDLTGARMNLESLLGR